MEKKELKTNKEDEFLEDFDKSFKTKLKNKVNETSLLIDMFHNYISQEFKKNDLHDSIIDKLISIEDDLRGSFNSNQKELFEKWESCRDELENYTAEQSFIYGYCLDKELQIERENYKNIGTTFNEEGKILNLEMNKIIKDDVICGSFIICGQENGNSTSLTDKQIMKYKRLFKEKYHTITKALIMNKYGESKNLVDIHLKGIHKLLSLLNPTNIFDDFNN